MKLRPWLRSLGALALVVPLATVLGLPSASAQFVPGGRKKGPAKPPATAPRRQGGTSRPGAAKPSAAKPAPSRPAPAADDERTEAKGESDALIARYTQVALSQPGLEFPIRRLAEVARQRDGNLDRVLADFETRAARSGAEQFGATVALAALYEQAGRLDQAKQTYERAAQLNPKSSVAELGLARLLEKNDPAAAMRAYERALPRLTGSERELTMRTLMRLALDARDFDAATRYHAELVKAAQGSL